jgi:glycosyltransferase involved in cell wall biosynthesis
MDLARHFQDQGGLAQVFSGLPSPALARHGIAPGKLTTMPFWRLGAYAAGRLGLREGHRELLYRSACAVDDTAARWIARHPGRIDLYTAFSNVGVRSGAVARDMGIRVVCHRGSTHIEAQQALLAEEFQAFDVPFKPFDPRIVERELRQYETADLITVPSSFARDSFIARGVKPSKVKVVPYGVNLKNFSPVSTPDPDTFHVIFVGQMSLRKGLPHLLRAFNGVKRPDKRLTLIGPRVAETEAFEHLIDPETTRYVGTVPHLELKTYMSRSHVLVLPSVEEGFGNVLPEAMACGAPVISTMSTGACDLFTDGHEGFIVPSRDAEAIRMRLQQMADDEPSRAIMGEAARKRIATLGGTADFMNAMQRIYETLVRDGA